MSLSEILTPACALFLDFDGTLVDIAPQPDAVQVPDALVPALQWLVSELGGAVAVVTGRAIEDIDRHLHPLRLPVAGIHGAERRSAAGDTHEEAPTPALSAVAEAAHALAAQHPGLQVEDKKRALALHFRHAPELEDRVMATLREAVGNTAGLSLQPGKMVAEAKPESASKGRAIEAFMAEPPFAGRVPVFIGDDLTDELGFAAVQRLGGLGVKVGPGSTVAWQRLDDPAALHRELAQLMAQRRAAA